jgi:hypothetical protein
MHEHLAQRISLGVHLAMPVSSLDTNWKMSVDKIRKLDNKVKIY